MKGVERPITYFEQAGYENTSDVVEIAYPGSIRPRALPVDECVPTLDGRCRPAEA